MPRACQACVVLQMHGNTHRALRYVGSRVKLGHNLLSGCFQGARDEQSTHARLVDLLLAAPVAGSQRCRRSGRAPDVLVRLRGPPGQRTGCSRRAQLGGSAAVQLEAKEACGHPLARTSAAIFATSVVDSTWAVKGDASATVAPARRHLQAVQEGSARARRSTFLGTGPLDRGDRHGVSDHT